jgi:hypothetical protein
VLLPVHNGEPYLREAIESVLMQTETDFELLVIDDGSTDSSADIVSRMAARDSRVRLVRQSASGLIETLNRGLAMVTCEFVARMDADDVAHPDRLARQIAFLNGHPACVAVGSSIAVISSGGEYVTRIDYPTGLRLRPCMSEGAALAHPSVMFRRSAVMNAGGYRPMFKHAEDYDLWLRLLEVGEIDNIPLPLLRYRQHPQQVSAKHVVRQAISTQLAKELSSIRRAGKREPAIEATADLTFSGLMSLPLEPTIVARIILGTLQAAIMSGAESVQSLERALKWIGGHGRLALSAAQPQYFALRAARAAFGRRSFRLGLCILGIAASAAPTTFLKAAIALSWTRVAGAGRARFSSSKLVA